MAAIRAAECGCRVVIAEKGIREGGNPVRPTRPDECRYCNAYVEECPQESAIGLRIALPWPSCTKADRIDRSVVTSAGRARFSTVTLRRGGPE